MLPTAAASERALRAAHWASELGHLGAGRKEFLWWPCDCEGQTGEWGDSREAGRRGGGASIVKGSREVGGDGGWSGERMNSVTLGERKWGDIGQCWGSRFARAVSQLGKGWAPAPRAGGLLYPQAQKFHHMGEPRVWP